MKKVFAYFVIVSFYVAIIVIVGGDILAGATISYEEYSFVGVIAYAVLLAFSICTLLLIYRVIIWAYDHIGEEERPNNEGLTSQVCRPHRLDQNGEERSLMWSDLKSFANNLNQEQLSQEVIVWGENDNGGGVYSIGITNDDLINPSGEGLEPVGMYADSEDEEYRNVAKEEPVVMKKGTIILEGDF